MTTATLSRLAPAAHTLQLAPASWFTVEQLTSLYNQTRVDYLVPMPMNAARLAEYIRDYDVDLDQSIVAASGNRVLGLGMLGLRPGRAWITRLGVLPVNRQRGVGRAILDALLTNSRMVGADQIVLEVIKNNSPAHGLFVGCGFSETRELLVMRRPPGPVVDVPAAGVRGLDRCEVLALLGARSDAPTWITATASLLHVEPLLGLTVTLPDGSRGWLAFQRQPHGKFLNTLSRLMLRTERGEPAHVARALLAHLYRQYPDLDTHVENVPADDPHLSAFHELGFLESFRRIEMCRPLN